MKKILVTGGNGRFAKILKNVKSKYKFIFRSKSELNILSLNSIKKNLKKFKPHYILHLGGLSRPMSEHEKNLSKKFKCLGFDVDKKRVLDFLDGTGCENLI